MTTTHDAIAWHPIPERIYVEIDPETNTKRWYNIKGMGEEYVTATQLDSLLKERDGYERLYNNEVVERLRAEQERDALQARVKELEEERACLKEGTSTAYSAMKKAIKLCQIDLKTDDWQNEDKSRRDLRLAIFRELDMPLAIVGNTERGGGPEKFCSSRLIEAEARAVRAEQERDEAYEWLKPFAECAADIPPDHDQHGVRCCYLTFADLRAARDLVRRLAGPEKEKPAANDGEERR